MEEKIYNLLKEVAERQSKIEQRLNEIESTLSTIKSNTQKTNWMGGPAC